MVQWFRASTNDYFWLSVAWTLQLNCNRAGNVFNQTLLKKRKILTSTMFIFNFSSSPHSRSENMFCSPSVEWKQQRGNVPHTDKELPERLSVAWTLQITCNTRGKKSFKPNPIQKRSNFNLIFRLLLILNHSRFRKQSDGLTLIFEYFLGAVMSLWCHFGAAQTGNELKDPKSE